MFRGQILSIEFGSHEANAFRNQLNQPVCHALSFLDFLSAKLPEIVNAPCLTESQQDRNITPMKKRLQQNKLVGPKGETVNVNWMPDGRLRLDFIECGTCVATKIFPDPKGQTHIEVEYRVAR